MDVTVAALVAREHDSYDGQKMSTTNVAVSPAQITSYPHKNRALEFSGGNLNFTAYVIHHASRLSNPRRFLDIGCGTGIFASNLAAASGMEAFGTELNVDAANVAMERINCHLVGGIDLPFSDGAFDLVIAKDVVPMIHNKCRWLSEIHRVLCSGGIFVTYVPTSNDFAEKPLYEFIPGSRAASLEAYGTNANMIEAFLGAGFELRESSRLRLGTVALDLQYIEKHASGFFNNTDEAGYADSRTIGLQEMRAGSNALAALGIRAHYEWERTTLVGLKK